MDEAVSSIAAPCCRAFSIATCGCPCNLAITVWGLSKLLIAKHQASASQVSVAVSEWPRFTNSSGYTGDACFTGGAAVRLRRTGVGAWMTRGLFREG
jgi:hypothetical protein